MADSACSTAIVCGEVGKSPVRSDSVLDDLDGITCNGRVDFQRYHRLLLQCGISNAEALHTVRSMMRRAVARTACKAAREAVLSAMRNVAEATGNSSDEAVLAARMEVAEAESVESHIDATAAAEVDEFAATLPVEQPQEQDSIEIDCADAAEYDADESDSDG